MVLCLFQLFNFISLKNIFFLTSRPVFEIKYSFHISVCSLFFYISCAVMNLDKRQSNVFLFICAINSLLSGWAVNIKSWSAVCITWHDTHTHTRGWTQTPLPSRHYVPWLANWLAGRLWLQRDLAGRNWKMGSPFFCPLSWTKDQSCFLLWRRWEGRKAQGAQVVE